MLGVHAFIIVSLMVPRMLVSLLIICTCPVGENSGLQIQSPIDLPLTGYTMDGMYVVLITSVTASQSTSVKVSINTNTDHGKLVGRELIDPETVLWATNSSRISGVDPDWEMWGAPVSYHRGVGHV